MNTKLRATFYFLLGASIILLDQISKHMALSFLSQGAYTITSFLRFNLVFNRGISFGIFNSTDTVSFLFVTGCIALVTLIVAITAYVGFLNNKQIVGEVLIIAGSLSNLLDRLTHRAVIDFIQLSYKGWAWPVFNCADCCIVLGVILIIIKQYRSR